MHGLYVHVLIVFFCGYISLIFNVLQRVVVLMFPVCGVACTSTIMYVVCCWSR